MTALFDDHAAINFGGIVVVPVTGDAPSF